MHCLFVLGNAFFSYVSGSLSVDQSILSVVTCNKIFVIFTIKSSDKFSVAISNVGLRVLRLKSNVVVGHLRIFQTICRPFFSDFEPGELFSTLVTHIRGSMSHMSHSDVINLTSALPPLIKLIRV